MGAEFGARDWGLDWSQTPVRWRLARGHDAASCTSEVERLVITTRWPLCPTERRPWAFRTVPFAAYFPLPTAYRLLPTATSLTGRERCGLRTAPAVSKSPIEKHLPGRPTQEPRDPASLMLLPQEGG